MLPDRSADYPQDLLKQELFTAFAGFPRKKIANFEIAYSTGELRKQKELAVHYVRASSAYMNEQKLSPMHVIHSKQTIAKKLAASPVSERKEVSQRQAPGKVTEEKKQSGKRGSQL